MVNWDRIIKLTPREVTALKELAAAGPRGRTSRAVRRDLALDPGPLRHRTISKHGHRDLCDHGSWASCPGKLKVELSSSIGTSAQCSVKVFAEILGLAAHNDERHAGEVSLTRWASLLPGLRVGARADRGFAGRRGRRWPRRLSPLLSTGGLGRVRYGSPLKRTAGGVVPYAEQQPRLAGATVEQN